MSDILDEILLEQSEAKKIILLRKLLPYVVSLSLAMAGGLFGYNWWQNKQQANNMKLGDILVQAIQDNSKETNLEILQDIIKNNSKVAEIASLKQVNIKILSGAYTEAKTLLEEIINNNKDDEVTLAYARIVWLSMMIDKETIPDTDKNFREVVLNYFNSDKQPFWGIANVFKSLHFIKLGQYEAATESLKLLINNKNISNGVRDIAQVILLNLSNKG